jgi:hypothetical protein
MNTHIVGQFRVKSCQEIPAGSYQNRITVQASQDFRVAIQIIHFRRPNKDRPERLRRKLQFDIINEGIDLATVSIPQNSQWCPVQSTYPRIVTGIRQQNRPGAGSKKSSRKIFQTPAQSISSISFDIVVDSPPGLSDHRNRRSALC